MYLTISNVRLSFGPSALVRFLHSLGYHPINLVSISFTSALAFPNITLESLRIVLGSLRFCLYLFILSDFFHPHSFKCLCHLLPNISHEPRLLSQTSDIYSTASWTSLFGPEELINSKTELLIFLPQNPPMNSHFTQSNIVTMAYKAHRIWPSIFFRPFFYYSLHGSQHCNHTALIFHNYSRHFST